MSIDRLSSEECFLTSAARGCLLYAKAVHDRLGADGLEPVQKNQHGETALRADIECEKAVIEGLRQTGIPIRVVSEEHGSFNIGSGPPRYLAVLDGLDGSSVYVSSGRIGGYGTMLGIFRGADPCYKDYLWSGVSQHAFKRIVSATKGYGADYANVGSSSISSSSCNSRSSACFDRNARINVDEHWEINLKTFSDRLRPEHNVKCLKCSAMHYVNIVLGTAELALECTRKGNLEIAVAYGLIRECGGAFVDMDGEDIGSKKFFSWGQDRHIPVVAAASRELALDLIKYVKRPA